MVGFAAVRSVERCNLTHELAWVEHGRKYLAVNDRVVSKCEVKSVLATARSFECVSKLCNIFQW